MAWEQLGEIGFRRKIRFGFTQRLGKDWMLIYYLVGRVGDTFSRKIRKVVLVPYRKHHFPNGQGVTVKLWKQIRFGTVHRYLAHLDRSDTRPQPATPRHSHRGRPSTMTTKKYRQLRREYEELLAKLDPAPAKTLAHRWGNVNRSTMRTWIAKAQTL